MAVDERRSHGASRAMQRPFDAVPVAIRVCLAALAGCACGFLFFAAGGFRAFADAAASKAEWVLSDIYRFIFAIILYVVAMYILIIPSIAFAVVSGLVLRNRIARRPFAWSMSSALVTGIVTCVVMTFIAAPNAWARQHSALERIRHTVTSSDGMLVLVGSLGTGLSFYLRGLLHRLSIRQCRRSPG